MGTSRTGQTMLYGLVVLLIGFLTSCSISSVVPENATYLKNHKVVVHGAPEDFSVSNEDLLSLTRQKPNRRILWTRLNLRIYTWLVPKKALARSEIRAARRCVGKNVRRQAKGKAPKECNSVWMWLAYTVGEPPVLLDSAKTEKSSEQMRLFLKKKGYFSCSDSIDYNLCPKGVLYWRKRNKARLVYHLYPGTPYRYRSIRYVIEDPVMERKLPELIEGSLLDTGQVFDLDILDAERERITAYFNNRGYYEFVKDYILYDADSTVGNRQVNLILRLKTPRVESPYDPEVLIPVPHKKYFIGNVYVNTAANPLDPEREPTDTLYHDRQYLLSNGELPLRPSLLSYISTLQPGELYQKERVDLTYKRFALLGVTRSVTVQLTPQPTLDSTGKYLLDAHILLNPAPKQSFIFDPRVTNRAGNMGVYTNLVYSHKNLFRGAERLEARIVSGFEASQVLGASSSTDAGTDQIERNFKLNTFEIGPEITISIPRLFPLNYNRSRKSSDPRAAFHVLLNYQTRPDYERTLSQFSFGWNFIENPNKVTRFNIEWAEISLIKIKKSPGFEDFINRLNDDFLANSYRDHLITATRLGFTLNTQRRKYQRSYLYYRTTIIEGAGNLLRGIFAATDSRKDALGSYEIAGIRFAQYVKTDHDFRAYYNVNERNGYALRLYSGIGVPLNNLEVLPFEKSFFAGGANGIRAWQARTLGPGSYRDTTTIQSFNNIGDIKLEFNLEYRFKITQMFQAALFVDAGNIWLLRPDDLRPGADFTGKRFLGEMAIGAGGGLRLDFEYFLVRFDVGYPLKDPLKVRGERWAWQPKEEYNTFLATLSDEASPRTYRLRGVFNIGIGFPF